MYQHNLDYRAKRYEETYYQVLNKLITKPIQNFHSLPYEQDTIDAAYQAEKDAAWFLRTRKPTARKKRRT